jgi:hypothetical protein
MAFAVTVQSAGFFAASKFHVQNNDASVLFVILSAVSLQEYERLPKLDIYL